jgi:glycine hydroxymethyltransferase
VIAAKAICFKEAMAPEFKTYASNIVSNAKVLADALLDEGFDLVTGGTDNHLMLADLRPMNITGAELQIRCDANHITLNKNAIPGDPQKPSVTSGVRIGTAAVTTRGLGAEEMKQIARCVALTAKDFEGTADEVKATVASICEKFPLYK